MISELQVNYLTLFTDDPLQSKDAVRARGYLGTRFSDEVLLHHHDRAGFVYTYPRVQFKVLDGQLAVVGIEEGIAALERMEDLTAIDLLDKVVSVIEMRCSPYTVQIGASETVLPYRFITPWLALNQKNVARYRQARWEERRRLLAKTIIGNILSMSKGLGIVVDRQLIVTIGDLEERQVTLKGARMTGFIASFSVNFVLPPLFGLGKAVSRGFGTVVSDAQSGGSWNST